jgi:hypothetical protein
MADIYTQEIAAWKVRILRENTSNGFHFLFFPGGTARQAVTAQFLPEGWFNPP